MGDKKLPAIMKADDLDITYPKKGEHVPNKVAQRNRQAINEHGIITSTGDTFIEKNGVQKLLNTDKKGANRFYNDLDNDDKFESGKNKYASVPAVQKEISSRIESPIDPEKRERLRDAENCVIALRDNPAIDNRRNINRSKQQQSLATHKRKVKSAKVVIDELTGQVANHPEIHHERRVADAPKLMADPRNLKTIDRKNHHVVHKKNAESPSDLNDLCKEQNWNAPKRKG